LFSENQFCSLSVWDLLRLTPWVFWFEIFTRRSSLCLLSFGLDLSPRFVSQDWKQTFYWSLSGPKGRFVCVWNCLIFIVGEYSSVWPEICRFLFRIQWRFLCGISGKKLFWENFSEIFAQTKAILYQNLWNFALFSPRLWYHITKWTLSLTQPHKTCS